MSGQTKGELLVCATRSGNQPHFKGFVRVPEGLAEGDLISVAAWPHRLLAGNNLSLQARPINQEESQELRRRFAVPVIDIFLGKVAEASSESALRSLLDQFNQREAKLFMRPADQDRIIDAVQKRSDALKAQTTGAEDDA